MYEIPEGRYVRIHGYRTNGRKYQAVKWFDNRVSNMKIVEWLDEVRKILKDGKYILTIFKEK